METSKLSLLGRVCGRFGGYFLRHQGTGNTTLPTPLCPSVPLPLPAPPWGRRWRAGRPTPGSPPPGSDPSARRRRRGRGQSQRGWSTTGDPRGPRWSRIYMDFFKIMLAIKSVDWLLNRKTHVIITVLLDLLENKRKKSTCNCEWKDIYFLQNVSQRTNSLAIFNLCTLTR